MISKSIIVVIDCLLAIIYLNAIKMETVTDPPPEYIEEIPIVGGVLQVNQGSNAIIHCHSNDDHHLFEYWQLNNDSVIGPSNRFDNGKYNYEILTGNLIIKSITPDESGIYKCISRGVTNNNINVKSVHVIVKRDFEELMEHGSTVNHFRIVVLVVSTVIIACAIYLYYKERTRHRLQHLLEEGSEEEDSGEEVFRLPSTSSNAHDNIILTDTNNTRIAMDFEDILKNSQMK